MANGFHRTVHQLQIRPKATQVHQEDDTTPTERALRKARFKNNQDNRIMRLFLQYQFFLYLCIMQTGLTTTLDQKVDIVTQIVDLYCKGEYAWKNCCKAVGVGSHTVYGWMRKHPELKDIYDKGKDIALSNQKREIGSKALMALHRKLEGWERKKVKHFKQPDGSIKVVEYYEKEVPDTDLIKFALINALPNHFKNTNHIESNVNHSIGFVQEDYVPPKDIDAIEAKIVE